MAVATGATEKRLRRAEQVRELRDVGGLKWAAIAVALGISTSYARQLYVDPQGAADRARKDSYRQPCPSCGRLMDGSNGRRGGPTLCSTCRSIDIHDSRLWTREQVIAAFLKFHRVVGRAPSASDIYGLTASWRHRWSLERLAELESIAALDIRLPTICTVRREFGSWAAAVEASGLPRLPRGHRSHRARPKS